MDSLLQDVRFGLRLLWRSPVVSCAIVFTLALGIGLDTAVFTTINGMLFRARVEKEPDSFVQLRPAYSGKVESRGEAWSTSVEDYHAYQAGARSVTGLAAWTSVHTTLGDDPRNTVSMLVTCNFFSLYGLEHATLGRLFLPEECSSENPVRVVVLSEPIWRQQFSADPHIIGKEIVINRTVFTVVGVAPRFPGLLKDGVWIPWTMQPMFYGEDFFRESTTPWLTVEGRLKPGYSKAAAGAELNVIVSQQDRLHPGRKTKLLLTNGSESQYPGNQRVIFWVVLLWIGVVTMVLIMACTNVATLLLSRAVARRQEISIRLSLGAGRTRLIRMLLTEGLMLVIPASIISAYLAYRVPGIWAKFLPNVPYYPLRPNLTVFAYLGVVSLVTVWMAGLAPAIQSLRVDLSSSLKGYQKVFGSGTRKWRLLDLLVIAQVALSTVLLVITGLVVRIQYDMHSADPGVEARKVLLVPLPLQFPPYTDDSAWLFYSELERRVRALPGVQSVSFASRAPFWGDSEPDSGEEVRLPGQQKGAGRKAALNIVSADYFKTLGIPILCGRAFEPSDLNTTEARPVAIISDRLSRTLWPHADPIGKIIEGREHDQAEVVGVARDTRSASYGTSPGIPIVYLLRKPHLFGGPLLIRFQGDAPALHRAFATAVRDMDREAIGVPRTLRWMVDDMASRFSILVEVVLVLGGLAALLAVMGIYGVVGFAVSRLTRELGIRKALGATGPHIMRLVFRSGMRPVLAGLLMGVLLAIGGSRVLAQVLGPFTPRPWDPLIYTAISALLALAAAAAMFPPALKASGAEPMTALREE